jgi:DNA-directed RNA polymerase subunit omega
MPEMTTRSNTQYALPDDPEQSMYRFILVAAKRARQIQNGARTLLPTINRKPTVTAMEEVRRGLVKYVDVARDGVPAASEQQPEE